MATIREGAPDATGIPTGRASFRRAEVAQLLGVSVATVDRAIRDGELTAWHLRGAVLVNATSLRNYIMRTGGGA